MDLPTVTLASVSYLNALPLIEGITFPIIKKVPSELLTVFQEGKIDAALLSIYDILNLPQPEVVNGIAIGCEGEVYSVLLAYQGNLKNIKKVVLDPSSHTANKLLKIILAEFYNIHPIFLEHAMPGDELLPRVIIGDPAIAFQQQRTGAILDLGKEWYNFTGLPFVFAMWCLNSNCTHKKYLIQALKKAKEEGLSERKMIAARYPDERLVLRYLTKYIRYDFKEKERQGLALFKSLLEKHSFISKTTTPLLFS